MCLSNGDCTGQLDFEEKINFAVFASLLGGPHSNHIAALAIALKQVATPEYKAYMQQVEKNAQASSSAPLRKKKYKLVTGGTDNHLLLWDLTTLGLTAAGLTSSLQRDCGKLQKEFVKGLNDNKDVIDLRICVEAFSAQFAIPGFDFRRFISLCMLQLFLFRKTLGRSQGHEIPAGDRKRELLQLNMYVEKVSHF